MCLPYSFNLSRNLQNMSSNLNITNMGMVSDEHLKKTVIVINKCKLFSFCNHDLIRFDCIGVVIQQHP